MDGHSFWVNSRALALAGITRDTPDPPNGRIERDPRTREPSGTLRESAMDLVYEVLPERTKAELSAGLERAQREANRFGITSVFAADEGEAELEAYVAADRAGKLTLRVVAASDAGEGDVDSIVARARALRTRYATPHVRPIAVKLYQDGVIEARTAAMLAPYLDRRGDAGTPNYDQPTLDQVDVRARPRGLPDPRPRHRRPGDPDDAERLRAARGSRTARATRGTPSPISRSSTPPTSRASARSASWPTSRRSGPTGTSISPCWPSPRSDPSGRAGNTRSRAWCDQRCRGVGRERLVGLVAQPARRHPGRHHPPAASGSADAPWNPEERVDLPTMIALYTINAAYALQQDKETGSIEVGKLADLVVLDRNLFELPADSIHTAKVTRTLLGGRTVYP